MNSHCFKLHRFYSNVKCWRNFSGVESERTLSKFRKRQRKFYVVFTYSLKRAREIRKWRFHVVVVQQRLRNVQKSVMHVQRCCLADINVLLFCRSRCCRRRRCSSFLLLWSRKFATIVTWRHTSLFWSQEYFPFWGSCETEMIQKFWSFQLRLKISSVRTTLGNELNCTQFLRCLYCKEKLLLVKENV